MANCILAFPDYVLADPAYATVTFSGGSWSADLPLSNLRNPLFAYTSRSLDLAPGSTRFWVNLGVPRGVMGVFVPKTNGTLQCQYRIRGFAVPDETSPAVVDSGWSSLYPVSYPSGSLFWGHPSLWDGIMSAEETAEYPMPIVETWSIPQVAQYWLIEFLDAANPAGYLDIPRILITAGWQPAVNMSWGATLAVEDQATVQEAISGAFYFEPRPVRRIARFSLTFLKDAESLVWVHDMQRRLGVSGQLFFVHDPDDAVNMHRRSFLARMRVLSPLEYAAYQNNTAPYELQEVMS